MVLCVRGIVYCVCVCVVLCVYVWYCVLCVYVWYCVSMCGIVYCVCVCVILLTHARTHTHTQVRGAASGDDKKAAAAPRQNF